MSGIDWLVAGLFFIAAALFIRSGLRDWRGTGNPPPLSPRFGLLLDKRFAADLGRSMLIVGLGFGFIAMMMADVLVTDLQTPSTAESVIFAVAVAGMIMSFLLALSVIGFNRPKFLVPPGRRAERGAFTSSVRPGARRAAPRGSDG
jgi:uncharacterized membrane protein (DUF485 family)